MVNETLRILECAEGTILRWALPMGSPAPMIWDSHPKHAALFLTAVQEVKRIAGTTTLPLVDEALLARAQSILEVAMIRLEAEFKHMLTMNSEPVDTDFLMWMANGEDQDKDEGDLSEMSSNTSEDEDEHIPVASPATDLNVSFDPLPGIMVKDLNLMAECMVGAGRGKIVCEIYVSIRKAVVEQSLYRLGMEKVNAEALRKMSWGMMDMKIKKWIQAFKLAVKVVWASEKNLCDRVYHGLEPWKEDCFRQLMSGTLARCFSFAKFVGAMDHSPEELFKILDMYQILMELFPEIKAMFCSGSCENAIFEGLDVLAQLGEAVKRIFEEFRMVIEKDTSMPAGDGAVQPLTQYVMNYIKHFINYTDCLEHLLHEKKKQVPKYADVEMFGLIDNCNGHETLARASPLALQIMLSIIHLIQNLNEKANVYKELALSFIFLMNNIHHIVQTVGQSELCPLLGDDWVRRHSALLHMYADNYFKHAWKEVLMCFQGERLSLNVGSVTKASRIAMEDRLKNFNMVFEEACNTQVSWVVPDTHLREWLRITIAGKLVAAYRGFLNHFGKYVEGGLQPEKVIKFTPDDVENHLVDLFSDACDVR